MYIYMNGNLAHVPVIYINVSLTPKATLLLRHRCFTMYKNTVYVFVLQGCQQLNPLTKTEWKPFKREYKHIYNVAYLYILQYLHILSS